MKITFTLIDDSGKEFSGSVNLASSGGKKIGQVRVASAKPTEDIALHGNPRAFMKRHATDMSGPQKFTLLLARLSEADPSKTVSHAAIEKTWTKMTGILGNYNNAYAIRAKDNGWVDTPKPGVYVLCPSWKEILA